MQSVKDIIQRFDRETIISELGVSTSAISNVLAANKFPASWYVHMQRLARDSGTTIPDDLFHMRGPDQ